MKETTVVVNLQRIMRAYLVDQETQNIENILSGKTVFFGLQYFINKIVQGGHCFICGTNPQSKTFNDEHIIPDWILRRFNLYNERITLPNYTSIKYGQYTVPCCVECNSHLGTVLEAPISKLLNKSYSEVLKEIDSDPGIFKLLYTWMGLIFLKTHLKDTALQYDRDTRNAAGKIGDNHDWADIHHIHCMSRVSYTEAIVNENVYGTMIVMPVILLNNDDAFDYMDSLAGQTAMIQVGETCIIASFTDTKAGLILYGHQIQKITGALTPFQLKEIFAHMTYINMNIKERPTFHSGLNEKGYEINATVPERFSLNTENERMTFGDLLHFYVNKLVPQSIPNRDQILQEIKEGKRRYLFNETGEFINHKISLNPIQSEITRDPNLKAREL